VRPALLICSSNDSQMDGVRVPELFDRVAAAGQVVASIPTDLKIRVKIPEAFLCEWMPHLIRVIVILQRFSLLMAFELCAEKILAMCRE
jgi:hypothetical protein